MAEGADPAGGPDFEASGPDFEAGCLVPDDASSLEPDRLAWLARERARRRRARLRRLVLTRRWERFGLSGPLVVACLLGVGVVGALAVVLIPRPPRPPPVATAVARVPALAVPARGATGPTAYPRVEPAGGGILGRRLPAVALAADVGALDATQLRPAVIALIPAARCGCERALHTVYLQAREFRLDTWLLMSGQARDQQAELVRLDESAAAGGARWAVDADAALARALAMHGVTLIMIRSDGVIMAVLRDLSTDPASVPALEGVLAHLAGRP